MNLPRLRTSPLTFGLSSPTATDHRFLNPGRFSSSDLTDLDFDSHIWILTLIQETVIYVDNSETIKYINGI